MDTNIRKWGNKSYQANHFESTRTPHTSYLWRLKSVTVLLLTSHIHLHMYVHTRISIRHGLPSGGILKIQEGFVVGTGRSRSERDLTRREEKIRKRPRRQIELY